MKKISFKKLSNILKEEVDKAGIAKHSSSFLLSYAWIKENKNKFTFKQYRIEYFPEGLVPIYANVPDWLNILLDGLEFEAKETISKDIKHLLKI